MPKPHSKKNKEKSLMPARRKAWKMIRPNLIPAGLCIPLIILAFLTYQMVFANKYYPFTYIGDSNVTFLTKSQATRLLNSKFDQRVKSKLKFNGFTIDLATSSAQLDYSILEDAFIVGHTGSVQQKIRDQFNILVFKYSVKPKVSINLDKQIDQITEAVYQPPQNAQLIFNEITTPEGSASANIQIKEAKNGAELDKQKLQKLIEEFLVFGYINEQLPLKEALPKVTTERVKLAKEALDKSQTRPIKLQFENQSWTLDTKQLLAILDLTSGSDLLLDKDKSYAYLKKISSEIDQEVQEGLFEFNPQDKRVTAFKPSQEGRKLDIDKTYKAITDALTDPKGQKEIILPVAIVKPKIQTSDVNSLGIKQLLGRGISNFAGSIPNRIYNINLTASKINGILIPPNETFSFNQTVGDISQATGFKQAYVIKEGRTVLDDGGGVCQDSTTLFRAVLNAGLPVVKRTAHAYRVGYYEQGFPPGLDATVFHPSVDFQFKNDTSTHILIQAYTAGVTLYVDLYGTADGRVSTISKPVVTNQSPPPTELRQDDPTLPKGTIKQVDWAAHGATVTFQRTVTRSGEMLIKEAFKSVYRPWQAVYLIGTKEN